MVSLYGEMVFISNRCCMSGGIVCHSLHIKPWCSCNAHNKSGIPENKPPEDLYAVRWRNMNGLLAHFTNHNLCTNAFRALACIIKALEEFRRKKPKTPINRRVPAAAIWFVLCPSMIYEACQRQECADREVPGGLWKGEPQQGYSIARWAFWRKRFGEVECHSDATEATQEACRAAIEGMDRCVARGG